MDFYHKHGKFFVGVVLVVAIVASGLYHWQRQQQQEKERVHQAQQLEEQRQNKEVEKRQKELQQEQETPIQPGQVRILGQAEVPAEQMILYIKKRNPGARLNCSVEELVGYYYEEGGSEGVRPDLALCQAIKETGCFAYGGDVNPGQNNYCGLGATGGGNPGASFASPREGVRAHIQHLMVYATQRRPQQAVVDPRYELVIQKHPEIYGHVTTWDALNGKWAVPGLHYGEDILAMLQRIREE